MKIKFRQRKAGVHYCGRIMAEHRVASRRLWYKRLTDAKRRVVALSNRPWDIESWTEITRARLNFASIWYRYKLRYERVTAEDFQAYIVMATI